VVLLPSFGMPSNNIFNQLVDISWFVCQKYNNSFHGLQMAVSHGHCPLVPKASQGQGE
jgi:hypothetical protein